MEQKTRGDEGRPVTALANYTLTLTADGGHGTVTGGGSYAAGSAVTLTATPASGYAFAKWSDGSYMASRTLTMPAQNTSLTAYFNARVPFGSGCSSITVPPIEPICSYPTLEGTTPLALEVPVPRFVLPVPPAECACFTFSPGTAAGTVTTDCRTTASADVSVQIAPADADCCTGRYTITPSLNIGLPCMPFAVKPSSLIVHNRSRDENDEDGHGKDGDVQVFSVAKGTGAECCSLTSALEITLPDCVKTHPRIDGVSQVRYCSRNPDGTASEKTVNDFIKLVDDPLNCTFYPEVKELVLPCCSLPDRTLTGSFFVEGPRTDGQARNSVNWTLKREDCETTLSFSPQLSCKCLSFTPSQPTSTSIPLKGGVSPATAKVGVAIAQASGTNCCDGQFVITPTVEIPACTLPNKVQSGTIRLSKDPNAGYFDWTATRTDCDWSFSLTGHPADCPCLSFSGSDSSSPVAVYRDPNPNVSRAKVSVGITRRQGTDCCDNDFVITPDIEIPACTLPNAHLCGGRVSTDGHGCYIDWSLDRANCDIALTMDPHIECACLSFNGGSSTTALKGGVSPATAKVGVAITKVPGTTCCDNQYVITPNIEIPACTLANKSWTQTVSTGRVGNSTGSVTLTATRTDCDWSFSLTSTPIEVNIPDAGCFSAGPLTPSTGNITASYKDSSGTTKANQKIGTFTFSKAIVNRCDVYTLSIENLDLTKVGGGASANIGSGGAGFQATGDNNLYLDGANTKGTAGATWYGGGLGDLQTDATAAGFRRGPVMRGNSASPAGSSTQYITHETRATKIISDASPMTSHTQWASTRKSVTQSGSTTTVSKVYASGYAHGNLSMVMPAGIQWHARGLALTLNEFVYNEGGLLSYVKETDVSALVAPAKAVTVANGTGTTAIAANLNASGLRVISDNLNLYTHGLSVDAGDGLRIYNIGDGTLPSTETGSNYDSTRQGVLEIMYGAGFRMLDNRNLAVDAGKYLNRPADIEGALSLNAGRGLSVHAIDSSSRNGKVEVNDNARDFMYYCSGKSDSTPIANEEAAKLSLRDTTNEAYVAGPSSVMPSSLGAGYTRFTSLMTETDPAVWRRTNAGDSARMKDIVIPIVMNVTLRAPVTSGGTYTIGVTRGWLRFTDTGLLLGVIQSISTSAPFDLPATNAAWDVFRTNAAKIL